MEVTSLPNEDRRLPRWLPRRQDARLAICNVLGGQVKTLVDSEFAAGHRRAAASIYLDKLATEGDTRTGTVTLAQ